MPADPDTLTTPQFREALRKVSDQLTEKQRAMLRAHYCAPGRKLTARQMAEAVGYRNHTAANLQCGPVGKLLCELPGQEEGSDLQRDGANPSCIQLEGQQPALPGRGR